MTSPTDPAVYLIDPEGDLFVRVVEFDYSMHRDGKFIFAFISPWLAGLDPTCLSYYFGYVLMVLAGGNRHIKKEGLMKVKRQVLSDHSDAFRAMLAGSFFEASQSSIEMKEVSVAAAGEFFLQIGINFEPFVFKSAYSSNEMFEF